MNQYAIDIARFIIEIEGGFVDHPSDPGGVTKYGISKRAYPDLDIPNLTVGQAVLIYERDYITPVMNRVTDERMQAMVSDAAVNHGLERALDWAYQYPTLELFTAKRIRFYTSLSTFDTFGKGWMNRISKVLAWLHDKPMTATVLVDNRSLSARLAAATGGKSRNVRFNIRPLAAGDGVKLDVA